MPKTNYAIDVAFEVVGNYHKFSDIPYSILIEHMEKRLADLKNESRTGSVRMFRYM